MERTLPQARSGSGRPVATTEPAAQSSEQPANDAPARTPTIGPSQAPSPPRTVQADPPRSRGSWRGGFSIRGRQSAAGQRRPLNPYAVPKPTRRPNPPAPSSNPSAPQLHPPAPAAPTAFLYSRGPPRPNRQPAARPQGHLDPDAVLIPIPTRRPNPPAPQPDPPTPQPNPPTPAAADPASAPQSRRPPHPERIWNPSNAQLRQWGDERIAESGRLQYEREYAAGMWRVWKNYSYEKK